ncbi:MAG: Hsp70 family protein [Chloroflexi bacterium]|nr:Hsp70 family protein [Chloroflexota bacterium]
MIVGMDFGTTNSGMAVYDGRSVSVLPLDPASRNPRVVRTAIYITTDQAVYIGRDALDRYFEHNVGRAVKMRKVWVGELEIFGGDMYYVTDAYTYVDVLSPGRLFLSVKSNLREQDYPGTVIGQHYYPLEDLIATYLTTTKIRAEQQLGRELSQVVLGRPVHFAFDEEHDRLAQARLMRAAFRAGYEKVYFQYEPIAAAYSYETTLDKPENVLIFDFGGGTLDITVMRLGDSTEQRVLATGGIPIAGDVFDQRLVRQKLARHFGEGSPYGLRHKNLTVPGWIYDTFANWQTILELQSAEKKRTLQDIAQTARRRYQIEALISLVSNNYGLHMFDIVEQAKRRLSDKRGTEILLEGEGFKVRDFVTRTEFERMIRHEILAIDAHLDEIVIQSGLSPDQIDVVIRTGGSAQVPVFYEMLINKFGEEKVRTIDTFSSVTAGLGVIAHGVEKGELDLQAYTPADDVAPPTAKHNKPNVVQVNLDLVQRRILALEQGAEASDVAVERALVCIDGEGTVTAVPHPTTHMQQQEPIPFSEINLPPTVTQLISAEMDEQILLISTHYRFVLTTPRQQMEHQKLDLEFGDLHRLERKESIANICRWSELLKHPKLLLVTSSGIARPYPLNVLRSSIEAPTPLKFDHALGGIVVAAIGTDTSTTLVMSARSGRAVRYPLKSLRTSGVQAFNCGKDDRIIAGTLMPRNTPLTMITADGYGRRLQTEWVPIPPKPNSKGKSMISRRSDVVIATTEEAGWIVTNERLVWVENGRFPLKNSTKTAPLIKLAPDETIHTFFP